MTGEELARLLSGPFLAACALLAVAGAAKIARPTSARAAIRALHLPDHDFMVRAVGIFELVAAVTGALVGGAAALAVALGYGALAVVAFALWRTAPATPCGCLGVSSTAPASGAHVAVNALAAIVAVGAALGGSPLAVIADQPLVGLPFVALTVLAAWLAALVLDALPEMDAAKEWAAKEWAAEEGDAR